MTGSKGWKRWMKIVWGVNVPPTDQQILQQKAVEFEVYMGGLRAVEKSNPDERGEGEEEEEL